MEKILFFVLMSFLFCPQVGHAKKYYIDCGSEGTYEFNTPSGWSTFFGGIFDFAIGSLQALYEPSGIAYGLQNMKNGAQIRASKKAEIEAQINYAAQYCGEKRQSEGL
ncbi:MAG: hypothetical protein LBL38_02415 [Lactobacillales bacterium]|nr:hypothetical protein [Lactobacillales bacterium]